MKTLSAKITKIVLIVSASLAIIGIIVLVSVGKIWSQPSDPAAFIIKIVRDDLSKRLHMEPNDIKVLNIEEVVWPDVCLGVGDGKEMCKPLSDNIPIEYFNIPGFRITLQVSGREYLYHTSQNGDFYIKTEVNK